MSKGANIDMSGLTTATGPFSWIDPSGQGEADDSVLLFNADGRVGGDADFGFYNRPATADDSVRLLGKTPTASGSEDRIPVDLTALHPKHRASSSPPAAVVAPPAAGPPRARPAQPVDHGDDPTLPSRLPPA